MNQVEVHSLQELKQFWEQMLPKFSPRSILLLEGDVGAGKTHSVQAIAEVKNLNDVASPSFAIHHRYQSSDGFVLDHLDLYRLDGEDDLESTGFWDLFGQSQSLIVIEWPQRIDRDDLPMNWERWIFEIKITGPTSRLITYEALDKP